jgi:hypothetical protein
MPKFHLGSFLVLALLCSACNSGSPHSTSTPPSAPTFTAFDAPGASGPGPLIFCGFTFGTYPQSINATGTIVGSFYDADQTRHGFIRSPGGTFIIVDAPGAGAGCPLGTSLVSINASATSLGLATYTGPSIVGTTSQPPDSAVFTRTPSAQVELYTPLPVFEITPVALNDSGTITGYYSDAKLFVHGFFISSDGLQTINAPNAALGAGVGTFPASINAGGDVVGWYIDSSGLQHGFLMQADGSFVSLDVPSTIGGTSSTGINSSGTIAGTFTSDAGPLIFLRTADGIYTLFTPPITGVSQCNVVAINSSGIVAGNCLDTNSVSHAFLLTNGNFSSIDDPDASASVGTTITGLNDFGAIIGYFVDDQNLRHGFIYQ